MSYNGYTRFALCERTYAHTLIQKLNMLMKIDLRQYPKIYKNTFSSSM
jgi:hypothetical protein